MKFNDFIGPETIYREYKEFSLHKSGILYDTKEIETLIDTNTFIFDELVLINIKKYIEMYLPKYACSFWNSYINGEFYIGTDDYGFIKGIPLSKNNNICKEDLTSLIKQVINKKIKIINEEKEIDLSTLINVDIIKIENPEPINGKHSSFLYYVEKKKEFMKEYHLFLESYKQWTDKYEMINMKLVDIVNIDKYRKLLIDFITTSEYRNESVLQQLYDSSFVLHSLTGEEIKYIKYHHNNIYYWVTTFKDQLCKQYKKDKPYFFNQFKYRHIPYHLLINMSEMIPYWSDQINLYIIKINFKVINQSYLYQYYNGMKWISCNRIIDPHLNQPICIPLS